MSAARERILARARAATESLPDRAALPEEAAYAAARSRLAPPSENLDTLASTFAARWEEVGGVLLESRIALETFLEMRGLDTGYVDPAAQLLLGPGPWSSAAISYERARVDEFDYCITVASFGIAETGSLARTDRDTPSRLAALAPWIHIAVLRKETLRATLADALAALPDDP